MKFPNLNRLAKWRMVFASWQLGTRVKGDPECDAVRDHREATMVLRAEVTALSALLIQKGVFTHDEFVAAIEKEAEELSKMFEERFPGFKATDGGMTVDTTQAHDTTKNWRP